MLNLNKNANDVIYEKTCIDIFETFKDSNKDISIKKENTNTELYNKVIQVELTDKIDKIRKKFHSNNYSQLASNNYSNNSSIIKNIEIAKIGEKNISINQTIDIVENLYKDIGNKLFGALLISNSKRIINPFHPIIAKEISENKIDKDENIYTLAIYTYKDSFDLNSLIDKSLDFSENIIDILANTSKESSYIVKNKNFELKKNVYNELIIEYEEEIYNNSTNEKMDDDFVYDIAYIIPIQVLNSGGVPFPYYGYIYTTKGVAWNLSPMYSANISRPSTTGNPLGGSRICSKIGSGKTIKGMSALNHSNLTSPLNQSVFKNGWIEYGIESFKIGFTFYKDIDNVKEKDLKQEPIKTLTLRKYLKEYPSNSRKDYLTYLKNKINEQKEWILNNKQKEENDTAEQPTENN